jgi:hypothetical protein
MPRGPFRRPSPAVRRRDRGRADGDARGAEGRAGTQVRCLHARGAVCGGGLIPGAQVGWHNALRAARSPAARPRARRPLSGAATARVRMGMRAGGR